jgi:glycosyltransferase involved in cell wall biosynthesis
MKRIAFFGPLPPSRTGIADYNAALLPLLRERYDIDVFLPAPNPHGEGFPHRDFFLRDRQHSYHLTLYQMGNQPHFHEYMYGYLFQQPGAIVFHDFCLHHSRADMLLKRNMTEEYRQELEYVYPDQSEKIANAAVTFAAGDLLFFHYPLFELVVRASLAAAAHTSAGVKRLQISETPVLHIPLIELPGGEKMDGAPLLPGKTVVASFGYATHAKRITTVLEAIAEAYRIDPGLRYVIVGALEDPADVRAHIARLGIQECVIVTEHVPMPEFLRWMDRADIVINLRYPSAGEMSATLIQALASGKPVIISRLMTLNDIPERAALRVRPDREKEDLLNALLTLLKDSSLRKRVATNARNFIAEHHSPEKVMEGYATLIETALERKSKFVAPRLPLHLRSAKEILREHLLKTSFAGTDPKILDWL